MGFEAYLAVPPHSSMHILAFHMLMVPPAVLLVVQQALLGQVGILVGIPLLMSLSQAMMSPAGLLPSFRSHH